MKFFCANRMAPDGTPRSAVWGAGSKFYFLSYVAMKFFCANRMAPDGTPRSAVSHLGLYCLPMSHKKGRQA